MDQKTIESILASIQSLKKVQRVIANKVIKLSEVFEKNEKKSNDRLDLYEKKLDNSIEPFANLKIIVEKHSDEVSNLEAELKHNTGLIEIIDKNLEEFDIKIEALEKSLELLNYQKTRQNDLEQTNTKQCHYDRKGYCRKKGNCKFFHADGICEIFLSNKICWMEHCKLRHPKNCRYHQRGTCYRGDLCRYLHEPVDKSCDRCRKISVQIYYCEFCKKNFCAECTVTTAHETNIYNDGSESPCCINIHQEL